MTKIGIAEISKRPSLLKKEEIYEIYDKKSDISRYIAIPSRYRPLFEEIIHEIEYREWLENNRAALEDREPEGFVERAGDEMLKQIS